MNFDTCPFSRERRRTSSGSSLTKMFMLDSTAVMNASKGIKVFPIRTCNHDEEQQYPRSSYGNCVFKACRFHHTFECIWIWMHTNGLSKITVAFCIVGHHSPILAVGERIASYSFDNGSNTGLENSNTSKRPPGFKT